MSLPDDKWLAWQRDHAEALAALQEAQRAYHRTVVGAVSSLQSAVDSPPSTVDSPQAESLKAVDAARVRLDAVRARKPE